MMYRYRVMPFRPVNGPTISIHSMHNMVFNWKNLTRLMGAIINNDNGTKMIIDGISNHAKTWMNTSIYMEAHFTVYTLCTLPLSLPKSSSFPTCLEFVSVDIATGGNHPAKSKHNFLKTWPKLVTICNVCSFIAFSLFYSKWIPWYESRIDPLCALTRSTDYDQCITPVMWSTRRMAMHHFCNFV